MEKKDLALVLDDKAVAGCLMQIGAATRRIGRPSLSTMRSSCFPQALGREKAEDAHPNLLGGGLLSEGALLKERHWGKRQTAHSRFSRCSRSTAWTSDQSGKSIRPRRNSPSRTPSSTLLRSPKRPWIHPTPPSMQRTEAPFDPRYRESLRGSSEPWTSSTDLKGESNLRFPDPNDFFHGKSLRRRRGYTESHLKTSFLKLPIRIFVEKLGSRIRSDVNMFVFWREAMRIRGLKRSTKDIDVLWMTRRSFGR